MKKTLFIILSYYLLQGIIHNLGHPITPTYVTELGIARYMFGFFFAAMNLGMVIGAPFWGMLGDKMGKRWLIVGGLLIYSVAQVLFGMLTHPVLLVAVRFLAGFGVSAHVTLALSHLIAKSPKASRTKYISWSAALFALGTTFGYQLGGFMGDYFIREVFYIQAVLNVGMVIWIALTIGKDKREEAPIKTKKVGLVESFRNIRKLDSSLLLFLIALSLTTISASTLSKYFDVYMTDLGYSPRELGTFIFVTGIVGLLTNAFLVPYLAKLRKDRLVMKWVQILSAVIVFYVFRQSDFLRTIYTVFLFYFVLKATFQPFEQNHISRSATEETYGTVMGIRQAFFSLGMVIGPILSGFVYDYSPIRMFDLSAVMFLFAFVLMALSEKKAKRAYGDAPLRAEMQRASS
ncbi:MAG: MFS transporter [Bacillota bacterium]